MKATGAIEKEKYANFHDDPTPAMFIPQVIDVTEQSIGKPFIIKAVPHVQISGQSFKPTGEPCTNHSPYVTGTINGQFISIHAGRSDKVGAFKLMVPAESGTHSCTSRPTNIPR